MTREDIMAVVADALRPANFYSSQQDLLEWQGPLGEELPWEIFRGRLLDASQTRERQEFVVWNLHARDEEGTRSSEPLLSAKLDLAGRYLYVTRAIRCYVWEGYDAGGNVYLSRETRRWVRELVGMVDINQLTDQEELRDELICRLFQAVVGASRLPLTSVEAPLPDFSLGQLAYFYRSDQSVSLLPCTRGRGEKNTPLPRVQGRGELARLPRPHRTRSGPRAELA